MHHCVQTGMKIDDNNYPTETGAIAKMLFLTEENLTGYIREHLLEKLGLPSATDIKGVATAGGGLVSTVFRARVGDETLYFKQAIPGKLDKIKALMGDAVPEDAYVVYYNDRQLAEVKALHIVKQATANFFVPTVLRHDVGNNIMVLSEVCSGNGVVLADVMNHEIHVRHAVILGENLARIANFTYGNFDPLRDILLEDRIKEVKYRYEVRDVWDKIAPPGIKSRIIERVAAWVSVSSAMNTVLVHGDFHDRNIIVCRHRCGTYDLEESHWGDPVEDIGKLITSYILRMIYFDSVRDNAYDAVVRLIDTYFENLTIPESREALETRMRVMVAGCLLMRVDGISSMWLPWVQDEKKKEFTRPLAVKLVLDEEPCSLSAVLKTVQN